MIENIAEKTKKQSTLHQLNGPNLKYKVIELTFRRPQDRLYEPSLNGTGSFYLGRPAY